MLCAPQVTSRQDCAFRQKPTREDRASRGGKETYGSWPAAVMVHRGVALLLWAFRRNAAVVAALRAPWPGPLSGARALGVRGGARARRCGRASTSPPARTSGHSSSTTLGPSPPPPPPHIGKHRAGLQSCPTTEHMSPQHRSRCAPNKADPQIVPKVGPQLVVPAPQDESSLIALGACCSSGPESLRHRLRFGRTKLGFHYFTPDVDPS